MRFAPFGLKVREAYTGHHAKAVVKTRKRTRGSMTVECRTGQHIVCKDCNCSCHWDTVLVRYFEQQGRMPCSDSKTT